MIANAQIFNFNEIKKDLYLFLTLQHVQRPLYFNQ